MQIGRRSRLVPSRELAVGLVAATSLARAEAPPAREKRAEFSADRVVLEPGKEKIALDGHVVVSVERYRLTSDHLTLARGPRGIVVGGGGRVALCPCPDPPLTFGFESATLAPPTDLFLSGPTVRVAGAPLLWLPYLWLRSPTRIGALPLRLAHRGHDGIFLGSGVHVPLRDDAVVDLGLGGYLRGGVEVEGRLSTPETVSRVRWDYFRSGAIAADLRGWDERSGGGSVAWSVDALRGARALHGPDLLEEVALRQDRARLFAGVAASGGVIGFLPSGVATRGGAPSVVDALGPGAYAGFGAGAGTFGGVDGDVSVATLARSDGTTTTLLTEHTEIRADGRAGPVVVGAQARARALATVGQDAPGHTAAMGAIADVEVPFVKTFGDAGTLQHWVTPFATGTLGAADTARPALAPAVAHDGAFYVAAAGLRSTLGESSGRRSAITASVRAGVVGAGEAPPRRLLSWNAAARAPGAALSSEGVSSLAGPRGDVVVSSARLGPEDGPFLGGHAVGQSGSVPSEARLLSRGWDAPWTAWLAAPGWSLGGGGAVPWASWLASAVDVDYDLTHRTLLGIRGTVAYRHPCGCLAVTLWGGHRLGRPGADSFLTVDLSR